MLNALIILIALILLAALIHFETKEDTKGKLWTKTPLSVLFIIAGLVQAHPQVWYSQFILLGLVLCLVGDVCLALPSPKAFMVGLIAFLAGHVFYLLAFLSLTGIGDIFSFPTLIILIISGYVYLRLKPHLGDMAKPVLAYIVIISLMLSGAVAVLAYTGFNLRGTFYVFLGAFLFYLSDIFVARDRFVKSEEINRRLGLPMYYCGQFLLAFSLGLIY